MRKPAADKTTRTTLQARVGVVEDVSLISNYRSQFDRVIAGSFFENLVRVMQEKQSQGSEKTS